VYVPVIGEVNAVPRSRRERRERTHDWQQIQQYTLWPEQQLYEKIRPVVLFGETAASRANETGTSERTLHFQADQFDQQGMASLFHKTSSPSPDKGRSLPPDMRQLIVDLKAEYVGFRPHEIATICFLRFGRKPSDHTVKRVLADGPRPSVTIRRYPPYAQISDPYQRRRAIVDLHAEGWSITTISAYLQTPRHRVYEVLKRWVQEGHAGLDDKPSTPHDTDSHDGLLMFTALVATKRTWRVSYLALQASLDGANVFFYRNGYFQYVSPLI
jgi:hypothetical protein